jgi:hypothetical protein
MCRRKSNRPFALVRDEQTGVESWKIWDNRPPFGLQGYKVVALFHDFWFGAEDDGDWNGPFRSREEVLCVSTNSSNLG